MNRLDNSGLAGDVKRLRRDLAELTEMARLGARIQGDEQRMQMIRSLLAQGYKIAPVVILDAVTCEPGINACAAREQSAVQGPAR